MRKTWAGKLLAMVLTGVTVMGTMPAYAVFAEEAQQGTTYYVSSENGDDANDGTSEKKAFKSLDKINDITLQPGDKVLLEKGSVFDDQYIHVKGSGSAEAPIEISTYGEGDRPQINANGKGVWYQDYGNRLDNTWHKYQGNVSSTILLEDVEYIEVRGLELTNDRQEGDDDGKAYNDFNVMDRTGVAGVAQNKGTINHIVLDDLYVHDVDGNVYNKHMANGGIYFIVEKPENESATGISKFDDLVIENCRVETTNRWGIAAAYTYATVEDILQNAKDKGEAPFIILLDNIEDPHNLGAIIRTANLAGAHGVIIPKRRAVGLTGTVAKTSAGAINYTPVAKVTNLTNTIKELKEEGLWFVCADMGGTTMYDLDLKGPIGLVIGSEGEGVSKLVKENCDFVASIPMKGDIDSLNASVAAGVLAYEILRQRG